MPAWEVLRRYEDPDGVEVEDGTVAGGMTAEEAVADAIAYKLDRMPREVDEVTFHAKPAKA